MAAAIVDIVAFFINSRKTVMVAAVFHLSFDINPDVHSFNVQQCTFTALCLAYFLSMMSPITGDFLKTAAQVWSIAIILAEYFAFMPCFRSCKVEETGAKVCCRFTTSDGVARRHTTMIRMYSHVHYST